VITHSEVGTGQKINPKICTGSITGEREREREREIMTTRNVSGRSKNECKNSFCHLYSNFGTTTNRFRLLSHRVRTSIY